MSRCNAYIVAYISRLEIGNVVLRPARLEVGHYDITLVRSPKGRLSDGMVTRSILLQIDDSQLGTES